jgi:hypothetical protein
MRSGTPQSALLHLYGNLSPSSHEKAARATCRFARGPRDKGSLIKRKNNHDL